jgi:Dinucleotide-utilizing enzymes involved in molybdopterin and thiamine biosynthesis family 1
MSVVISDAWRQRFGGTARLYGENALQLFAQSHVCVVGIGGVGSWAAEALARTGIGAITLIDMDDVCVTNTNRQIHALRDNVGLAKAEVMAERIRLINPECQVNVVDDFVTPDNVAEYMSAGFSYVIDAIDSVRPKAALIAYCRRNKIPLVTTGGAGGQIDPTQIQVVDLAKTIQDPLAAKLRERLKSDFGVVKNSKGKLGVDCVFSTEALVYPQADGSVCAMKATAERAETYGLRVRIWCGHYGDGYLWLCSRFSCAKEDDGESGAPELIVSDGAMLIRPTVRAVL